MMDDVSIGIVGGSGLYKISDLQDAQEIKVETPFGDPSDTYRVGMLKDRKVAFLPRHGRGHNLLPSEVPHRANVYGFKKLGVKWLISASAVGSLKEELKPRDFVLPLQFVDKTKNSKEHTFFGNGIVAHVSFGEPVCETLATVLFQSARMMGATVHWGGTYVNMEGPAFSTRAESEANRHFEYDVIGMTNLAEAKLAREAEISYASLSMVTDYDCWHEEHDDVSVADVVKVLHDNAELGTKTVVHAVQQVPLHTETKHHKALETAVITPKEHWPEATAKNLELLIGKK